MTLLKPVVYCVGELLIDMFCTNIEESLKEGRDFQKMAGGAPANVAATISKLGGQAAFAGKVGNDPFGDFLIDILDQYNVDTSMVEKDSERATTIAFVSLMADGERDFQFNRGADENLDINDLDVDCILMSKIVHYGSATALLAGTSQDTYFTLMEKSSQKGVYVSFDPNYRMDLWGENTADFINLSKRAISYADFVKVSEEELYLITEKEEIYEGILALHELGAALVAITMGKDGTYISNGETCELIPSISVKSIDSTGAGDAFVGAFLYQLAHQDQEITRLDFELVKQAVYFANKVGATVCQKIGSLTALPALEEIME